MNGQTGLTSIPKKSTIEMTAKSPSNKKQPLGIAQAITASSNKGMTQLQQKSISSNISTLLSSQQNQRNSSSIQILQSSNSQNMQESQIKNQTDIKPSTKIFTLQKKEGLQSTFAFQRKEVDSSSTPHHISGSGLAMITSKYSREVKSGGKLESLDKSAKKSAQKQPCLKEQEAPSLFNIGSKAQMTMGQRLTLTNMQQSQESEDERPAHSTEDHADQSETVMTTKKRCETLNDNGKRGTKNIQQSLNKKKTLPIQGEGASIAGKSKDLLSEKYSSVLDLNKQEDRNQDLQKQSVGALPFSSESKTSFEQQAAQKQFKCISESKLLPEVGDQYKDKSSQGKQLSSSQTNFEKVNIEFKSSPDGKGRYMQKLNELVSIEKPFSNTLAHSSQKTKNFPRIPSSANPSQLKILKNTAGINQSVDASSSRRASERLIENKQYICTDHHPRELATFSAIQISQQKATGISSSMHTLNQDNEIENRLLIKSQQNKSELKQMNKRATLDFKPQNLSLKNQQVAQFSKVFSCRNNKEVSDSVSKLQSYLLQPRVQIKQTPHPNQTNSMGNNHVTLSQNNNIQNQPSQVHNSSIINSKPVVQTNKLVEMLRTPSQAYLQKKQAISQSLESVASNLNREQQWQQFNNAKNNVFMKNKESKSSAANSIMRPNDPKLEISEISKSLINSLTNSGAKHQIILNTTGREDEKGPQSIYQSKISGLDNLSKGISSQAELYRFGQMQTDPSYRDIKHEQPLGSSRTIGSNLYPPKHLENDLQAKVPQNSLISKNLLLRNAHPRYISIINNQVKSTEQLEHSKNQHQLASQKYSYGNQESTNPESLTAIQHSRNTLLTASKKTVSMTSPQNKVDQKQREEKKSELIQIHVFDENRKSSQNFKCEKDLLVKYMHYFDKYLNESTSANDIDISVHCDVKIFDWLIRYLRYRAQKEKSGQLGGLYAKHVRYKKKGQKTHEKSSSIASPEVKEDAEQPVLDLKNVISILISSNFLQMQELVNECISYVVSNLHDIVRLPIDMSCINESLLQQISAKVPLDRLDKLFDKRDKLTSKLFLKKLENLLYLLSTASSEDTTVDDDDESNWFNYGAQIHDFLWQSQIGSEIQKSLDQNLDEGIDLFAAQYSGKDSFIGFTAIQQSLDQQDSQVLQLCQYCGQLFPSFPGSNTQDLIGLGQCKKAKDEINFYGQIVRRHKADNNFDLLSFLHSLNFKEEFKWKEVFWKVWATVQVAYCASCEQSFSGIDFEKCKFHTKHPQMETKVEDLSFRMKLQDIKGSYPCCQRKTLPQFFRCILGDPVGGCLKREHELSDEDKPFQMKIIQIIQDHAHIIFPKQANGDNPQSLNCASQEKESGGRLEVVAEINKIKEDSQALNSERQKKEEEPAEIKPILDFRKLTRAYCKDQKSRRVKKSFKSKQRPQISDKLSSQGMLLSSAIAGSLLQPALSNVQKKKTTHPNLYSNLNEIITQSEKDTQNLKQESYFKPLSKSREVQQTQEKKKKVKLAKAREQVIERSPSPDQSESSQEDEEEEESDQNEDENEDEEEEEDESSENSVDEDENSQEEDKSEIKRANSKSKVSVLRHALTVPIKKKTAIPEKSDRDQKKQSKVISKPKKEQITTIDQNTIVEKAEKISLRKKQKREAGILSHFEKQVHLLTQPTEPMPFLESAVINQDLQFYEDNLEHFLNWNSDEEGCCLVRLPKFRKRRKMNHMYQKVKRGVEIKQNPIAPVACGLGGGGVTSKLKIPYYLKQGIGFMGNQITAPFEYISRSEQRKRRLWRKEYLAVADGFQINEITKELKRMRVAEQGPTTKLKKKKTTVQLQSRAKEQKEHVTGQEGVEEPKSQSNSLPPPSDVYPNLEQQIKENLQKLCKEEAFSLNNAQKYCLKQAQFPLSRDQAGSIFPVNFPLSQHMVNASNISHTSVVNNRLPSQPYLTEKQRREAQATGQHHILNQHPGLVIQSQQSQASRPRIPFQVQKKEAEQRGQRAYPKE